MKVSFEECPSILLVQTYVIKPCIFKILILLFGYMDSKKKRGLVGEVERKLRPLWLILPELRLPVQAHLVTPCLAESTTRTNLFSPGYI
jgi:hypothetical protein